MLRVEEKYQRDLQGLRNILREDVRQLKEIEEQIAFIVKCINDLKQEAYFDGVRVDG